MYQQRRVSRRVSVLTGVKMAIACLSFAATPVVVHGQNLADHVGGYLLGDFESVTPVNLDTGAGNGPNGTPYHTSGPGYSDQGGLLYTGPASAVVGLDANNNPTGVWSDFGDIQPQYNTGNNNLLFYQQSTGGATHGSKAFQAYNVFGSSTPDGTNATTNGMLELLNSGGDLQTAAALRKASSLKFDVTFDRSLMQNPIITGGNPFTGVYVAINIGGPTNIFLQGNISYDSLSTLDPATLASTHRVTTQPNYRAGTMNYTDTNNWPGTAPEAPSYSQNPVVTGTGSVTLTMTVDFTKNLQNGAPGYTGDGSNPPTWLLQHNSIAANYDAIDPNPANTQGLSYGKYGTFYNILHIYFQLGSIYQGGVEVDNIRYTLPGDFNQDGHVDAADIKAGEAALADLNGYMSTYKMNSEDMNLIGDVNGDNKVTNADLQKLLSNLIAGQGSTAAVPEPTTLCLLGLGGALLVARRRFRRA